MREERRDRRVGKVGRPRMPGSLRELIVRLARENAGWGMRRIVGELKKLAVKASRSTVRRILVEEDILPDPEVHRDAYGRGCQSGTYLRHTGPPR